MYRHKCNLSGVSLGRPHTPVALNHHTSYSKSDLHCGACQWYWESRLRYGQESGRLRYARGGGNGPTDNTGRDDWLPASMNDQQS